MLHRLRMLWYSVPTPTWCRHLSIYWETWDKGNLLFFPALFLPIGALAAAIYWMVVEKAESDQLRCLAYNVYYESRGEPLAGQYAVAEVTLNRVASERYPDTICKVVYEKRWDRLRKRYVSAFSWTELDAVPKPSGSAWQRAKTVAAQAHAAQRPATVGNALFYHAKNVRPSWARKKKAVARIGNHIFYE